MADYIKRDVDKIIDKWFAGQEKSLMILGARQVGKTFSIRHFIRKQYGLSNEEPIPEINLATMDRARELLIGGEGVEGISFMQYVFTELQINVDLNITKIVFVDEIQALSNDKKITSSGIIKSILSRLTKEDGIRFIFSGSLLGSKISNLETLTIDLSGGIQQVRMYPITLAEFIESIDGNQSYIDEAITSFRNNKEISKDVHIHLLKKFAEYSFVGGMPKAVAAYIDNKKYKVSDSQESIASLTADYNSDIAKYFREEHGIEIVQDIFNYLLFGLKNNDKQLLMKKIRKEAKSAFYDYLIDSDVGLLVSHISELNKPLNEQEMPKTYFNDIGFLRCIVKEHIDAVDDPKNPPKHLIPFYDVRNIDLQKDGFVRWIDGDPSNKPNNNGAFFEQIVAQSIKAYGYQYAYNYRKNPEQENEFILIKDETAIEVKSGGFSDFASSRTYAESGKKVIFATMLPYFGEYVKRFYLLPVYLLCLLKQEDLLEHKFVKLNTEIKTLFECGLLPDYPGFFKD